MKAQQDPGFLHSLICFGGVIITVIVGLLWLGISLHSLLLIALVWVAIHSVVLGFDFAAIKSAMISGIEKGLGAMFIFFLIGVLIAAYIEGGHDWRPYLLRCRYTVSRRLFTSGFGAV